MDDNRITYFAETDARDRRVRFGIKAKDRTRHVYTIGKTGMGKSTMLENMAVQDIMNGEGMCFIDPHGKTADLLLEYVPKERIRDVIYIAPFDMEYPISFNVLESVDPQKRHLVVSGLMSTFKKIWEDAWSARMEYILTNTLLALLEAPGSTLLGVNRMLSDKEYRKEIVNQVQDPSVKAFWTKEFANYTERMAAEAVPAIQNKVGQFTANPLIRNMIGQPKSSFDIREAMDKKKIIIINLSKGRIGDENMKLLGGLLVTKIYLAAMSRADVPDRVMKVLPNFYLFVDEFQNFANASFADILSEARKYKLNLTIAHQYIEQMDEIVRPAVFGNVGTMIVFRVGATDAEELEKEFAPQFEIEDLVNLGFTQIYLKLMIDGLSSSPFSATTLPPIPHPDASYVSDIIAASREQFTNPRATVEAEIIKFHNPVPKAAPTKGPAIASSQPYSSKPASGAVSGAPGPAGAPINAVPVAASLNANAAVNSAPKTAAVPLPTAPKQPPQAPLAPKEPPKPATHKPFADLLKKVQETGKPAETAKPVPVETAKSASLEAEKQVPAPMPLSSLAPKRQQGGPSQSNISGSAAPKVDPKIATQKNVNDLKNALAAALGKSASKEPSSKPVANAVRTESVSPSAASYPDTMPSKNDEKVVKSPTLMNPTARPAAAEPGNPTIPKEVPEEVLKKILKVE